MDHPNLYLKSHSRIKIPMIESEFPDNHSLGSTPFSPTRINNILQQNFCRRQNHWFLQKPVGFHFCHRQSRATQSHTGGDNNNDDDNHMVLIPRRTTNRLYLLVPWRWATSQTVPWHSMGIRTSCIASSQSCSRPLWNDEQTLSFLVPWRWAAAISQTVPWRCASEPVASPLPLHDVVLIPRRTTNGLYLFWFRGAGFQAKRSSSQKRTK